MSTLPMRDGRAEFQGAFTERRKTTRFIVVHHAAALYRTATGIEDTRAVAAYHRSKGWGGIGYHIVLVEATNGGPIEPILCSDLDLQRAHIWGRNHEAVGVSCLTNFTGVPAQKWLDALAEVLADLKTRYPDAEIVGHRDIALPGHTTACPGPAWPRWRPTLERLVIECLARPPIPAPPPHPYTVMRAVPVRERPAPDAPIAWGGAALLPVGQVVQLVSTDTPGWLHWPAAGFVPVDAVAPFVAPASVIDAHLPVLGTESACTPAQALAYLTTPARLAVGRYTAADIETGILPHYVTHCHAAGVRFDVAIAQLIKETGSLSSFWGARPQRNPAGIGVTGQWQAEKPATKVNWRYNDQRSRWEVGLSFPSWAEAVPAHVYRLLAYAAQPKDLTADQRDAIRRYTLGRPLPLAALGSAPQLLHLGAQHNLANVGLRPANWRAGWAWPGTTYGQELAGIIRAMRDLEV